MSSSNPIARLACVLALASSLAGCGGCQDKAPEAPPKPVQGNVPPAQAPAAAPVPAQEAKEICAVLIFANVDTGSAPLSAQLTAEGDCTSGTARFDWDFGDGSPGATGETVVHTFEKPGNYTVTGKISSDALPGAVDSDTVDIVVTAPQG
jgi:hypothetical protein